MELVTKPAFDPRRGVVAKPKTEVPQEAKPEAVKVKPKVVPIKPEVVTPKPEAVTPKPEVVTPKPEADKLELTKPTTELSRLEEQQQAAKGMLNRLGSDAKLAAIMLNPLFAPHANAIAWQATGRAIARYETEVPRRDLSSLMNEEQTRARKEIVALPQRYAAAAGQAIDATGNAIEHGAKVTGDAIANGTKAVGNGIVTAGAAVVGGFFLMGKSFLKGLGNSLTGLGKALEGAGSSLKGAAD